MRFAVRPEAGNVSCLLDRRRFMAGAAGTLGALVAGRRSRAAETPATTPAETAPDETVPPRTIPPEATLTVRIRYDGEPIRPTEIDCGEDPYCTRLFKDQPLRDESVLVGEGNALRNVFVSVTQGLPGEGKWPVPSASVVVDQKCRFIPRIFGVMAGQPLDFHNSSKTLEVPHGHPRRNREFSFNVPEGQTRRVVLPHPEVFRVTCDVHPWELAYCHVLPHPFFAVSDERGEATIIGLPPGRYEIGLWHEKLEPVTFSVVIEAGRPARIEDVTLKPASKRRRTSRPAD